ncbi:histidine phosphatase family protein [Labedaea rhizosphaerae]|uniref:histidine phosphatase family protein n=1 Tax=Labedaea rhizosphaerae TaxID=598644 RepID=UPI0010621C00|nr:histidine phosphatase family protein [Labedaea rhizosphaerae]
MRLMLVRHGQTASNVRGALDSALPGPPLTEEGLAQAKALAERLADEPVNGVYASQAVRAQQTAQPVAEVHRTGLVVVDGVHEVQAGDLEGRTDAAALGEFAQVFHRWTRGELHVRMPGAQSGAETRERFVGGVEGIRSAHEDGLVVLVSHGGIIRLGTQWLVPDLAARLADQGLLHNTGHVVLEADGAGWRCLEWSGLKL